MARLLVTGYGPFGPFETNPSRVLAEGCGCNYQILEVSYRYVDQWLEALDPTSFDSLLLMGVNGGAKEMHLEQIAHNRVGRMQDVHGWTPSSRRIQRGGPWRRRSTLWVGLKSWVSATSGVRFSATAGSYLCNFALYRALALFPDKAVGFLHVPPVESLTAEVQAALLERLLTELERRLGTDSD